MVLFGLILVNFFPLKIFPKIKPPTSENMHIANKKRIFNFELFSITSAKISNENVVR